MGKARRIIMRIHLWFGLGVGALMVLAGLTGSALVFYVEIDNLLHPEQHAGARATLASYDRALATLRMNFPGKTGQWRFEITGRPGAIPARYNSPPETAHRGFAPLMVWLSPDGGQVLRRDFWGDYAMTWIYDLHYRLQLGKAGGQIFGYAGLALLALLISGLGAWWPRGSWGKALRFKRATAPMRRLRDIHKLVGLAAAPLLLMLTITGIMLALPAESDATLSLVLEGPGTAPSPLSADPTGRQISPAMAARISAQVFPNARLAWIEVPGIGNAPFRLRLQQTLDPSARFPHSYVWLDQHNGRVLAVSDIDQAAPVELINSWLHPLHDGSVGGLLLRILVLVTGLLPCLLLWTGLKRWQLKRE